ncbi:hypothetical protein [Chitinophaga sancti]|uniref:Uncharacterized protein n=1 Tax=Chitinophaga sancti TaxID=1004 RepID=A0A1K1SZQ4_9BACT|nr:hypothetical protein [Chitinophaga sancti]WQD65373.1 hypothetical protein U0033_13310 [Chitinophaga sancti]WQG89003.1 hypothetical protein SR876_29160 [Chitinophaga sancti]SFW89841.1 hypothetical protein SAMN05661012_06505 [Chitinophaga sancti]
MEKQTLSPHSGRNYDLITAHQFLLELDYEKRLLLSSYRPSNQVKFPEHPVEGELIAIAINPDTNELKLWEGVHKPGQPKLLVPANLPDVLRESPDLVRQIRVDLGYGYDREGPRGYLLTKAEGELLNGKNPVTIIAGYPYEVDVVNDTVTPLDKKGQTFAFSEFKVIDRGSEAAPAYAGFFDARSRSLVEPWNFSLNDVRKDLWQVSIPELLVFDPVALAKREGRSPHHYLPSYRKYSPVTDHAKPFTIEAQIQLIRRVAGEISPASGLRFPVNFPGSDSIAPAEAQKSAQEILYKNCQPKRLPENGLTYQYSERKLTIRSAKRRGI